MIELPPVHVDTAQQKLALRRNPAAKHIRTKFPRGTRVEATGDRGDTGNGRFGTVAATILHGNSLGGVVKVLWDDPNPFTGQPVVGNVNATVLRVVGTVERVAARDVRPGDVVEGRTVEYVTYPVGRRSGRVIKFVDGGRWVAHHAEKLALVRQLHNAL